MRTIALTNQKGGVGKTTTAVNLAASLAHYGRRVLIVDCDAQTNATLSFGINPAKLEATVYDIFTGEARAEEVIVRYSDRIHVIPSTPDLAGGEAEKAPAASRGQALKQALAGLTGYDFVLVDCPPTLGLINVNVLVFVEEIIIPMQCQFFALQGISLLLKTIDLVQKRVNPRLKITGVLPCMFDGRTTLSREVLEEIGRHFGDKVYRTRIRSNVRLAEAPSFGKPAIEYAPESNGAQDYLSLAREVLGMPDDAKVPAELPKQETA
ncbi:MAG: ParA family protein [Planctomycetia bacterium]|nr:ParA family protein [Planctomycetia bacterium]